MISGTSRAPSRRRLLQRAAGGAAAILALSRAPAIAQAVRKKLVMAALWTEVCLTFPLLDAIRDGYEAYPVVDAVGGTSREAHRAGLARLLQAGARPVSGAQFLCELQRDWARTATVARGAW